MTRFFALLSVLIVCAMPVWAASGPWVERPTSAARLITVQDTVAPGSAILSAGLHITLEEGWKTYWRSPGEVGLPPEIDWSGSTNIDAVTLNYPAPKRFTAFEIENFGYGDEVLFPLSVQLQTPGRAARLSVSVTILVCAEVCIPETFDLSLDIPKGALTTDTANADLIATWLRKVPVSGQQASMTAAAGIIGEAMRIEVRAQSPFTAPDAFPERGVLAAYGKPDLRLSQDRMTLWAEFPILSAGDGNLTLTVVDGARAATMMTPLGVAPNPPDASGLWPMILIALLGGLILNVMPCVLPVLSIKFTSALSAVGQSKAQVRAGFLASALGVMVFFWALALILLSLRAGGMAVGWGIQFQSPVFLGVMLALILLFTANMLGLFEITLPQSWTTRMAHAEGRGGVTGDFLTGAFAAVMATPCSAPFLGTAVTYALSGGPREVLAIFTALGLGLAAPYLLIAARPAWISHLPKPGPWMAWVKRVMALALLATALWLASVLWITGGIWAVALVVGITIVLIALLWRGASALAVPLTALVLIGALVMVPVPSNSPRIGGDWGVFDADAVPALVANGEVVFVDVTADWCITCIANKRLVLDRDTVAEALRDVTMLQADWTRPNADIQAFLKANGRFGIPFNIVYGPGAPEGIVLPELLTKDAVLNAIAQARG